MNTGSTLQIASTSSADTEKIGAAIGRQLKGGEVLVLASDLGGGKTTLVRGLAAGMGSADRVSSPSFTIANEYHADGRRLYHLDFYRLNDPGIVARELAEFLHDPEAVVAIEWADIVDEILPEDYIAITIKNQGEDSRLIEFAYPESRHYLMRELA